MSSVLTQISMPLESDNDQVLSSPIHSKFVVKIDKETTGKVGKAKKVLINDVIH